MSRLRLLLEGLPDHLDNIRPKLELYFRNKRRSGGEISELLADPNDRNRAFLVYADEAAFHKVSERKHQVQFKEPYGLVELQVKVPADDEQQGPVGKRLKPPPVPPRDKVKVNLVNRPANEKPVVWKIDQANDEEVGVGSCSLLVTSDQKKAFLQMYFEQFAAEPTLTKHGINTWILQLSNRSDMETVRAKKVHDHGISVVVYDERSTEGHLDPRRFVLSGFDDSCICTHVSVYVGSCSHGAEHVWETLDDGDTIVVTFKQYIDVNDFMRKCSSKKFQDKEIGAHRLEMTDSVFVQGDMSTISEEALNIYFSNKRSGGGDIKSIRWVSENKSAIVTFEECDVAYKVAEQKHSFFSKELKAQLFYCSLQKALTGEMSLQTNITTNTVIPVSAELLNFISCNESQKQTFTSALEKVHSSISISMDIETPQMELSMTLDTDTLGMLRQGPAWEMNAQSEAQVQLNRYTEEHLPVEVEVWKQIENSCFELPTTKSCISFKTSTSEVVVVGTQDEVKRMAEKVRNMVKKTGDELQIKRDTVETEIHLETKEKLDLIWDLASRKMETNVVLSKDDESLSIHLKGQRNAVNTAEGILNKALEGVDSITLVMSPHLMNFIKSIDLKKFQRDHFAQSNITAVLIPGQDSCQILGDRADIHKAEDKLHKVIQNEVIEITGEQVKIVRGEHWDEFLEALNEDLKSSQNFHNVSIKRTGKKIEVCGFSGVVTDVLSDIKAYLEDKKPVTEDAPLKSLKELEFVQSLKMFSDDTDLKALGATIYSKSQASPCLKVKAESDKIKQATDVVTRLIGMILTQKLTYSNAGEAKILEKNELMLTAQAKRLHCVLSLSQVSVSVSVSVSAATTNTHPCSFDIGGCITLTLDQGDISQHTLDALICPMSSLAFDNPIAQQFLQSGGPEIKQVIDKFQREKRSLGAGDVFLTNPGTLKCKKLTYAVIPVWGKGIPSLHASYLQRAVHESLMQAESNQCVSIGMPALGCGTFGFPVKDCCEAIMAGILNFNITGHSVLTSIHMIDSDANVVEEFKSLVESMGFDQTNTILPFYHSVNSPKTSSTILPPHGASPPLPPKKDSNIKVIGGVIVTLKKGDITKEAADIIVNSTNQELNLNTGVSGAILKAAGKSVVDECNKHGSQKADGVVLTSGGNLRCKHIAHMVGPSKAIALTVSTEKVLQLCESKMAATIAFPTIGTGSNCMSPKDCLKAILKAVENHTSQAASSSLKRISVVAFEDKIFNAMSSVFCKKKHPRKSGNIFNTMRDVFCKNKQPQKSVSQATAVSPNTKSDLPPNQVKIHGVRVEVKKGDITLESVKGIVNTTSDDIDWTLGGVCGAIFKEAGPLVKQQCQSIRPLRADQVGLTSGGALRCNFILHMVGPHNAADITARVRKVLECCEDNAITTLSLPAVGTGNGGVSGLDCVEAILQGITDHLSSTASTVLKLIYVVIQQDSILQAFLQGFIQWKSNQSQQTSDDSGDDGGSSTSEEEEEDDEAMVGPVKVKVVIGDITRQRTDAVVNSTNASLDLSSGVSGAILKAAGQSVVDECSALGTQPSDGVVITKPGKLSTKHIKHIIHMVGQSKDTEITSSMRKVLQMCEDRKLQSVSFPALGTGAGNLGAKEVGNAMMAAVEDHIKSTNTKTTLKSVHIVIFHAKMIQDFKEVLKKYKKVTPKKYVTKKAHHSPPKTSKPAMPNPSTSMSNPFTYTPNPFTYTPNPFTSIPNPFTYTPNPSTSTQLNTLSLSSACRAVSFPTMEAEVMGCSAASLAQVKQIMDDLISEECHSQDLSSSQLPLLLESEKQAIVDLSRKSQVSVLVSAQDRATVSGKRDDVLAAVMQIREFLQKAKERESRQGEEKRLCDFVCWEAEVGGTWGALDQSVSLDLEHAWCDKRPSITYSHSGQTYTVDLKNMRRIDGRGTITRVKRTLKADSDTAVIQSPPTWTQMHNKDMDIVDVAPTSGEYKEVKTEFIQTSKNPQNVVQPTIRIVKIQRIQNIDQWQRYAVKKHLVDKRYPTKQNEMNLYHGTTSAICQKINVSGFNRSFCGRNATVYGNGTYFAKGSWYSLHDTYSSPDADGIKYMYRARVLVGKPCQGTRGMLEPSPLSPGNLGAGLHDCAVDNPLNPLVYVVFCDAGAYPDYLITFKTS